MKSVRGTQLHRGLSRGTKEGVVSSRVDNGVLSRGQITKSLDCQAGKCGFPLRATNERFRKGRGICRFKIMRAALVNSASTRAQVPL